MTLKRHLAKRYIPPSIKWKLVLKGVGKLYRAIFDELEENGKGSSAKRWPMQLIRLDGILEKVWRKTFSLETTLRI